MAQYKNIEKFLSKLNYKLTVSNETYYSVEEDKREVKFQCDNKHDMSYNFYSFRNLKASFAKKSNAIFCYECNRGLMNGDKFEEYKKQVYDSSRHVLVSYDTKTREAKYICGRCGNRTSTCLTNLLKSMGGCGKCETVPYRNTYNEVKQICDEQKIKLQWTEPEYKTTYQNNKQLIPFTCICGRSHSACLADIKSGKKCQDCKKEKYKSTCIEKYGCENAFQNPEIKKKIKDTFREKYGVDHPLQNPQIFYKNRKSMYGKKEFVFPSGRKEIVMGYEPLTLNFLLKNKNYLVNRPLHKKDYNHYS